MKLSYQQVSVLPKKTQFLRHQIVFLHGEYYYASGTICAMGQRNVRD